MMELYGPVLIGILLIGIGIANMKGNISMLHSYHRKRIKDEDKRPFGTKVGIGTIITGVTIIINAVVIYITGSEDIANWIITIGFTLGIGIILYSIIKYNKGLF